MKQVILPLFFLLLVNCAANIASNHNYINGISNENLLPFNRSTNKVRVLQENFEYDQNLFEDNNKKSNRDMSQDNSGEEELEDDEEEELEDDEIRQYEAKIKRLKEKKKANEEKKKKLEAERKAKEEAERKAKEEADRKAKEEAERKANEEADRKAKEEAEKKREEEEAEKKRKEEEAQKRYKREHSAAYIEKLRVEILNQVQNLKPELDKQLNKMGSMQHTLGMVVLDKVIKFLNLVEPKDCKENDEKAGNTLKALEDCNTLRKQDKTTIEDLNEKLTQSDKINETFELNLKTCKDDLSAADQQFQQEKDAYIKEINVYKDKFHSKEGVSKSINSNLITATNQLNQAKQSYKSTLAKYNQCMSDKLDLQKRLDASQGTVSELQKQTNQLKQNQKETVKSKKLIAEKGKLNDQLKIQGQENVKLQRKISDKNNMIQSYLNTINSYKTNLNEKENQLEIYENNNITQKYSDSQKAQKLMSNQRDDAVSKNQYLDNKVLYLKNDLELQLNQKFRPVNKNTLIDMIKSAEYYGPKSISQDFEKRMFVLEQMPKFSWVDTDIKLYIDSKKEFLPRTLTFTINPYNGFIKGSAKSRNGEVDFAISGNLNLFLAEKNINMYFNSKQNKYSLAKGSLVIEDNKPCMKNFLTHDFKFCFNVTPFVPTRSEKRILQGTEKKTQYLGNEKLWIINQNGLIFGILQNNEGETIIFRGINRDDWFVANAYNMKQKKKGYVVFGTERVKNYKKIIINGIYGNEQEDKYEFQMTGELIDFVSPEITKGLIWGEVSVGKRLDNLVTKFITQIEVGVLKLTHIYIKFEFIQYAFLILNYLLPFFIVFCCKCFRKRVPEELKCSGKWYSKCHPWFTLLIVLISPWFIQIMTCCEMRSQSSKVKLIPNWPHPRTHKVALENEIIREPDEVKVEKPEKNDEVFVDSDDIEGKNQKKGFGTNIQGKTLEKIPSKSGNSNTDEQTIDNDLHFEEKSKNPFGSPLGNKPELGKSKKYSIDEFKNPSPNTKGSNMTPRTKVEQNYNKYQSEPEDFNKTVEAVKKGQRNDKLHGDQPRKIPTSANKMENLQKEKPANKKSNLPPPPQNRTNIIIHEQVERIDSSRKRKSDSKRKHNVSRERTPDTTPQKNINLKSPRNESPRKVKNDNLKAISRDWSPRPEKNDSKKFETLQRDENLQKQNSNSSTKEQVRSESKNVAEAYNNPDSNVNKMNKTSPGEIKKNTPTKELNTDNGRQNKEVEVKNLNENSAVNQPNLHKPVKTIENNDEIEESFAMSQEAEIEANLSNDDKKIIQENQNESEQIINVTTQKSIEVPDEPIEVQPEPQKDLVILENNNILLEEKNHLSLNQPNSSQNNEVDYSSPKPKSTSKESKEEKSPRKEGDQQEEEKDPFSSQDKEAELRHQEQLKQQQEEAILEEQRKHEEYLRMKALEEFEQETNEISMQKDDEVENNKKSNKKSEKVNEDDDDFEFDDFKSANNQPE